MTNIIILHVYAQNRMTVWRKVLGTFLDFYGVTKISGMDMACFQPCYIRNDDEVCAISVYTSHIPYSIARVLNHDRISINPSDNKFKQTQIFALFKLMYPEGHLY